MIIIAAMTEDRIIGSDDGLPWHIPAEYQQYLDFVRDQTVIMGRRTYAIFKDDLTSAHNVVVSRSEEPAEGAAVAHGVDEAVALAESYGTEVFCAGGGSIYAQCLPLADAMYLSFVKGDYQGDTRFPEWDDSAWRVERRVDHPEFELVVYRRV